MDRYPGRITVKLGFCSYGRPPPVIKGGIRGIEHGSISIDYQCLIRVGVIGKIPGDVQLDMVPGVYRPTAREGRRNRNPLVVRRIPEPPDFAIGVVTLYGHVKLVAIDIPVGVIFESLNTGSIVCVNPEILQKMRDGAHQIGVGTVVPPKKSIRANACGIKLQARPT